MHFYNLQSYKKGNEDTGADLCQAQLKLYLGLFFALDWMIILVASLVICFALLFAQLFMCKPVNLNLPADLPICHQPSNLITNLPACLLNHQPAYLTMWLLDYLPTSWTAHMLTGNPA